MRAYYTRLLMNRKNFKIIQEFPLVNNLYPINLSPTKPRLTQAKTDLNPEHWHRRVGHSSPERYYKLSEIFRRYQNSIYQSYNLSDVRHV